MKEKPNSGAPSQQVQQKTHVDLALENGLKIASAMTEADATRHFFGIFFSSPPSETVLKRIDEKEQITALFFQLSFLLDKKKSPSISQLLLANTFKLNLPSHPTIATSYEKLTARLKTLQSGDEFFKLLNYVATATILTCTLIGIVLGSILAIGSGAAPLAILVLVLAIALSAGAVYGLLVALPQFLYGRFVRPGKLQGVLDLLTAKESLVQLVDEAFHVLNPDTKFANLQPYDPKPLQSKVSDDSPSEEPNSNSSNVPTAATPQQSGPTFWSETTEPLELKPNSVAIIAHPNSRNVEVREIVDGSLKAEKKQYQSKANEIIIPCSGSRAVLVISDGDRRVIINVAKSNQTVPNAEFWKTLRTYSTAEYTSIFPLEDDFNYTNYIQTATFPFCVQLSGSRSTHALKFCVDQKSISSKQDADSDWEEISFAPENGVYYRGI